MTRKDLEEIIIGEPKTHMKIIKVIHQKDDEAHAERAQTMRDNLETRL